jgi:RHS repeat-associated protein
VGWSGQALTFGYDASGERLGYNDSVESGIRYTLRGLFGQVLREYFELNGSWSWVKDHVWAGGELIATVEPTGTKHLHRDHLGSVRLETSGTGAVVATHSYWPFGEEITVTSSSERYRFAGHERDQRTGYDYMHARYYAPMAGRFFSVDPGRDYDFSHPQSFNLYAYVRNNPVNAVDPSGKWLVLETDPLSTKYLRNTRNALIEALRRPTTRYLLVSLAGDTRFRVAFGAESLNSLATWAAFRQGEKQGRFDVKFQFGKTEAEPGVGGVTRLRVLMDWPAINGPGRLTGHQGGLTTLGHEVGSHVMDLYAGKDTCAIRLTDENGFAEALGRELALEPPDMSREQAEKLLDELLALGKQLEEEYQKQLVMVTSNTNPVTQKSEGDRP